MSTRRNPDRDLAHNRAYATSFILESMGNVVKIIGLRDAAVHTLRNWLDFDEVVHPLDAISEI